MSKRGVAQPGSAPVLGTSFMEYVLPMALSLSQPKREPKDVPLYHTMGM